MNIHSLLRSALSGSFALLLTVGGASLAHATLVQRMPDGFFAAVPKSWGQCRWQGGLGVTAACELEDCPEDGGKADCTEPEIVPPNGRPWADADPNGFIYGMCDEHSPYTDRDAVWCEAAGGTWNGPDDCADLPDVVVGGGGSAVKDEAASETIAEEFERRVIGGCGLDPPIPTPWAVSAPGSYFCWDFVREQSNGKILRDMRYTDYRAQKSGSQCDPVPVEERVYFRRDRDLACPVGYTRRNTFDGDLQCVRPMSDYCPTVGNPIAPISGAKLQTEADYRAGGIGGLEFVRYYNSQGYFRTRGENNEHAVVGQRWRHTYQRSLHFYSDQTYAIGAAHRPNGYVLFFDANGNELHNRDGAAARLVKIDPPTGTPAVSWKLTLADDSIESYDASGRLLSIRTRSGRTTTMGWTGGKLTSVTDPFGRSLSLSYGANGRIQTLTQPDSGTVGYTYDDEGRLLFAAYPDSTAREYHYELGSPYSYLLTGITDENEVRYATFSYYGGFAASSQHAGGVDNYQLTYSNGYTTVTDPLGTTRQYTYYAVVDGVRKLNNLSQPCASCGGGNAQATTYDTNGNVTSRTDFNGNRTNYTFDATRNLETSRTEGLTSTGSTTAVTRTITTTWHSTFRLPATITEPDGNGGSRVTTFTYDSEGNLLEREITAGSLIRAWAYTYDTYGRMLTEDGPRTDVSDVTTYTWYANNAACVACRGQLHTVTNALGHVTTYTDYDANGRATRVTDPNGVITAMSYHARGWPTQRTLAYGTGAAETTQTTYDNAGLAIRVTQPVGSYVDVDYDDAHRVVGETDLLGNTTVRMLDNQGNEVAYAAFDPLAVKRVAHSRTFDALGRLTSEVDAYGATHQYGYDANSNRIAAIDAAGGMTTTSYDVLNRPVSVVDASGGTMVTTYDAVDQVRTVTDPNGLVTTYGYDGLGNQTSLASPDTGLTSMTFDAVGNMLTSTDARGITTTAIYDALNRPLERTSGSGGSAVTIEYVYDLNTNGKGRLTSATGGGSLTELTYDAMGRTIARSQTIDTTTRTIQYTYDSGLLVAMTYPSGADISYSYTASRQSKMSINGSNLVAEVRHVPFGAMDGFTFAHGPAVNRQHDLVGRIAGITLGPLPTAVSTAYEYDVLSRLMRAQVSDSRDYRYSYDATGNRTLMSLNSASTSYGYVTGTHRLDASTGAVAQDYAYDDAGNTVERGSDSLTYDARGRLIGYANGGNTSYQLNAFGQRVQKDVSGDVTQFMYDEAGTLIGEYLSDGSGKEYIYLNGLLVGVIADLATGEDRHAIYADHLGTPRTAEQIDTGEITWGWSISGAAFGEDSPGLSASSATSSPLLTMNLRFPGQYFDEESGLHYNYFRSYDPAIGRYVESDPIGLEGGISTFVYVGGNSLRSIDPQGLLQGPMPPVVPPPVAPAGPGLWGAVGRACLAALSSPVAVGVGLTIVPTSTSQCADFPPPAECPKQCPPCITVSGRLVPPGTIGFRPLDVIPDHKMQHGVYGSHHNLFRANQWPYPRCDCFWQKLKNVAKPGQLNPDWVPIEPFVR